MTAVETSKVGLATVTLVHKYKALKEIDGDQTVQLQQRNMVWPKTQFYTG